MRQRQKDHISHLGQRGRIGFRELQRLRLRVAGKPWEHLGHRQTGGLPGSDGYQFGMGMLEEKPHQFLTRVSGGTDNRNALGHDR